MEKGLFNALMPVAPGYAPAELTSGKRSYILSDHGFTHLSNNPVAPFFSVFEEPENGFGEALGDGEEIRRICAAMSRPETMRAILYIHSKEPWYLLDGEVLARECDIPADLLDGVLADLGELCLIKRQKLEVDGKTLELYSTRPSHKLIALMILARELHYWSGYSYQSQHRSKPYIR